MIEQKYNSWREWIINNMGEEELEDIKRRTSINRFFIEFRNIFKISQKELAELCNVKQPMIARIEKGDVNIGIKTLNKILEPMGYELTITKIKKD